MSNKHTNRVFDCRNAQARLLFVQLLRWLEPGRFAVQRRDDRRYRNNRSFQEGNLHHLFTI